MGFPGGASDKEEGDPIFIPRLGKSPGEENGNAFQDSCFGSPTDRGAWWATVHEVSKSQTQPSN